MSESEEGFESPPETTETEYQNAIFHMVISWCKLLTEVTPIIDDKAARTKVADYLDSISNALRVKPTEEPKSE